MKIKTISGIALIMCLTSCQLPYSNPTSQEPKRHLVNTLNHKQYEMEAVFRNSHLTTASLNELKELIKPEESPYRSSVHISVAYNMKEERYNRLLKLLKSLGLTEKKIHKSKKLFTSNKTEPFIIDHYTVIPPNCPDWSMPTGMSDPTIAHSNYGCAQALNDYWSVEDPAMLFVGYKGETFPSIQTKKK